MSAWAADATRVLPWASGSTTAAAAVATPANNRSADAEGVEIPPAPTPSGDKNLLSRRQPMAQRVRYMYGQITTVHVLSLSFYTLQAKTSRHHTLAQSRRVRGGL